MRKIVTLLLFAFGATAAMAQETTVEVAVTPADSVKVWTSKGNVSLLLNQSSFSNWVAGGENNISGTVGINYDLNYKKDDWTWDNKLIASYGLVKTAGNREKKTDDRLEFNSLIGKKAVGYWSYSFFLNFKTQFTDGFKYDKIDGVEQKTATISRFLSPGYLTFGPGMLWKKNENLKFNLAPVTSKLTFVDNYFTSVPGYVNGDYFGVDANKILRYELGFYASGYYKLDVMTNVSFENILSLYSNYLEDSQNVDLDYQLNVVMKINKYLSTNLSFQAIYDDNAFRGFQTREVFGLGVNFGF